MFCHTYQPSHGSVFLLPDSEIFQGRSHSLGILTRCPTFKRQPQSRESRMTESPSLERAVTSLKGALFSPLGVSPLPTCSASWLSLTSRVATSPTTQTPSIKGSDKAPCPPSLPAEESFLLPHSSDRQLVYLTWGFY